MGVERDGRAGLRVREKRDARARDGRAGASAFVDDAEGVDDSGGRRARNGGRVVGLECGDVDNARAVRDARRDARLERDLDHIADGQLREMNLDAARDDGAFVRVVCVGERAVVQSQRAGDVVESFGQVVLQTGVAPLLRKETV